MVAAFAFDKTTSPVRQLSGSKVIKYQPCECMAVCKFDNVYWSFERAKNYAPKLVFEGYVERLDAMDNRKFADKIDTVYFNKNKPPIKFTYDLDDGQMSELAKKGFWGDNSVEIPSLFTSSKFQLETYASVEAIDNGRENDVPILNVELVNPYNNRFNKDAYDLVDRIMPGKPATNKVIENMVQIAVDTGYAKDVEAAKTNLEETFEESCVDFSKITDEEIAMNNTQAEITAKVNTLRDERAAERVSYEAAEETEHIEDNLIVTQEDKSVIERAFSENINSFHDNQINDKKAIVFMQSLAERDTSSSGSSDGGSNSDTGNTSGVQGLGVYTFEDQDTAQFAMRVDEGKGNEKEDKLSDEASDNKSDRKDAIRSFNNKKAYLSSVSDMATNLRTKEHNDDRSK